MSPLPGSLSEMARRIGRRVFACGAVLIAMAIITADLRGHPGDDRPTAGREDAGEEDNADVRRWIAELGSAEAVKREAATAALIAAGPRVVPEVRKALASDDREVQARAKHVADALEREAVRYLKRAGVEVALYGAKDGASSVTFQNMQVTSDQLIRLPCIRKLRYLQFQHVEIADDSLRHLAHVDGPLRLMIKDAPITDAGVTHLAECKSLLYLSLGDTEVTGRGLGALAALPRLETLSLDKNPVTDDALVAGLAPFSDNGSLRVLGVYRIAITNAGVAAIAKVDSIESLVLNDTQIDDGAVKQLKEMPRLSVLQLSHANITDAAAPHLASLPAISQILLVYTNVTRDGVSEIRSSTTLTQLYIYPKAQ